MALVVESDSHATNVPPSVALSARALHRASASAMPPSSGNFATVVVDVANARFFAGLAESTPVAAGPGAEVSGPASVPTVGGVVVTGSPPTHPTISDARPALHLISTKIPQSSGRPAAYANAVITAVTMRVTTTVTTSPSRSPFHQP